MDGLQSRSFEVFFCGGEFGFGGVSGEGGELTGIYEKIAVSGGGSGEGGQAAAAFDLFLDVGRIEEVESLRVGGGG